MNLEDVKEHYKVMRDAENENRKRWKEDLLFGMAGDQWPSELRRFREDDPDGARPCLTINKLPVFARGIINDMRQNRGAIDVLPVDDLADVDTAEIIKGMIRHIEHVSNASMAYDVAAEYQVYIGMGYFRIEAEMVDELMNYQDLVIRPIRDPLTVTFDFNVNDSAGADAKRVFIEQTLKKAEYKLEYPEASEVDWSGEGNDGWIEEDEIKVVEHYWMADADTTYVYFDGKWMLKEKYETSGIETTIEKEQTIKEPRVHWQKVSGAAILDGGETGEIRPGRFIPIIRVVGEDFYVNGKRHILGIVFRARDPQLLYNYGKSAEAEVTGLQPKAPWVASDEAILGHEAEWANANIANTVVLTHHAFDEEGRPLQAPARVAPAQPNMALVNMVQGSDADLAATIGRFDANLGKQSNERSGIAIEKRQRVGDLATYHYPDNMSHAIRQGGRVLVDLIPYYYDTDRIARTLGEDGEVKTVRIKPGGASETADAAGKIERIYDLSIGKYDVAVTTGPSYNTKRQDAFESMARMVEANPQLWAVIGDLLVKNMDWPGAQEMAKRVRATIPPEILQDEEEGQVDLPPEIMAQIEEAGQAYQALQEAYNELQLDNDKMNEIITGKVVEREMKQMDVQIKTDENAQKADDNVVKMADIEQKRDAAQLKLAGDENTLNANLREGEQETERAVIEFAKAEQTPEDNKTDDLIALLVENMRQQAEMAQTQAETTNALIEQISRPRKLTVETDAQGNVTGGESRITN